MFTDLWPYCSSHDVHLQDGTHFWQGSFLRFWPCLLWKGEFLIQYLIMYSKEVKFNFRLVSTFVFFASVVYLDSLEGGRASPDYHTNLFFPHLLTPSFYSLTHYIKQQDNKILYAIICPKLSDLILQFYLNYNVLNVKIKTIVSNMY